MMRDRRVWVVTDGRPGNEGPARALARALQAHGWAPAEVKRVVPRRWAAWLPAGLWARLPARRGGWPFVGYEGGAPALAGEWPELLISAGRRSAPAAAAMRALGGVRAVQILDPRMGRGRFDAVVVPRHDRRAGGEVIGTLGSLSRVTPEVAAEAAGPWRARLAELPEPRLAVLVGGPSGSARWGATDAGRLAGAVAEAAAEGWGVMVTGSRRTPQEMLAEVREAAPGAFVWDGAGENPYPGVLGLAGGALVTADSVNMVSEAASAGVPVNLFRPSGLSRKLRRFGDDMVAGGYARVWDGRVRTWEMAPLDEAGRVAAVLAERL